MAADKLDVWFNSAAAELFELIRGCADLPPNVIANIVQALIVAGYRKAEQ